MSSPPANDASSPRDAPSTQDHSPPVSVSPTSSAPNGQLHNGSTPSSASSATTQQSDLPTPLFERSSSSASSSRPFPPSRSMSYKTDGWNPAADAGTASMSSARAFAGTGQDSTQRTTRAASDGAILAAASSFSALSAAGEPGSRAAGGINSRLSSLGSDEAADEQAFYREHQRRSLEHSASQRLSSAASKSAFSPPLASARLAPQPSPFFQQSQAFVPAAQQQGFGGAGLTSPTLSSYPTPASTLPPLLSPTSTSPPSSGFSGEAGGPPGSKGATLHLGDLDVWMDEAYVRECCALMGWDAVSAIKMSRGASPASGYCFLTFPTTGDAQRALARFNASPPMLMPRSGRTFKLNWGTGLPGLQPRWDGEFSVFVGDLAREVGEADLMTLFTPLFPSTKSAKVMCDPSTGLSRGYGFVRFTDEADVTRALRVGANAHSGLLLHGRTIRISEASGPGSTPNAVEGMPHLRERTRTRSGETQFAAQQQQQQVQQQGYFPPYPPAPAAEHHQQQQSPFPPDPHAYGPGGPAFPSPLPLSPYGAPPQPMVQPGLPRAGGRDTTPQARAPIPQGAVPASGDPNNTTVFVGGLPACISEETLKSFFHHFGEITYCKIPPGKGCGFVQFVRRQDAELAIAKMNDFPIHGKSRIRLSWGRSQGDKQVEHVRKLASALGVPFDAVWRMVQGQDNSTIKQIASAVGSNGAPAGQSGQGSPPQQHQARLAEASATSRMDLRAVANAAGLSESEVLDLVKNGNGLLNVNGAMPNHTLGSNGGGGGTTNSSHSSSAAGSDFFARSSAVTSSATSLESSGASQTSPSTGEAGPRVGGQNPYSRVSPSSFSSAYGNAHHQPAHQHQQGMLPLSPPPAAGPTNGGSSFAHHQAQHPPFGVQPPPVGMHHSPYTAIRPDSYLVQPPAQSPYERVDFADGGRPSPNGFMPPPPHQHGGGPDRYHPQAFGFPAKWHEQPHVYDPGNYTTAAHHHGAMGLDDAFDGLNLGGGVGSPPRSLPPPANSNARHAFQPTAPDFFPGALASPTTQGAVPPGASVAGEANWSWGGVSAA